MSKDNKPAGPSQRMLRVGELVRHALAAMFARGEIEDERTEMAPRFEGFKEAVGGEVTNRGWFRSLGIVPLLVGIVILAAIGALLPWIAQFNGTAGAATIERAAA